MDDVKTLRNKISHLEIENIDLVIEELAKYLFLSIKNNREINNSFVYELVNKIIELRNLDCYVNNIISYDYKINKETGFGAYYPKISWIEVYLYNIREMVKEEYKNLNKEEKNIFLYMRLFIICFHEIEHANQIKLCIENIDSVETLILRNSMNYIRSYFGKKDNLVKKGYKNREIDRIINKQSDLEYDDKDIYLINPSERFAWVKSFFVSIFIFSSLYKKYPLVKQELFYLFYDMLLEGYQYSKSPTIDFIQKFHKINDIDLIKKRTMDFCIEEKSIFGMELKNCEKNELDKRLKKYLKM